MNKSYCANNKVRQRRRQCNINGTYRVTTDDAVAIIDKRATYTKTTKFDGDDMQHEPNIRFARAHLIHHGSRDHGRIT
jgi:hypothetical protein